MSKKKLKLADIKVKSFVLDVPEQDATKAGHLNNGGGLTFGFTPGKWSSWTQVKTRSNYLFQSEKPLDRKR